MGNMCLLTPPKGAKLHKQVQDKYDRKAAWNVHKVLMDEELGKRWSSLTKDSEGFPLLSELIEDPVIRYTIGEQKVIKAMEKKYEERPYTPKNYTDMLQEAYNFNKNPEIKGYMATVIEKPDGGLKIAVSKRNTKDIMRFNSIYSANQLNMRLSTMFASVGVTPEILTKAEVKAGRVGVTTFSAVKNIAKGFSGIIRIANNIEGDYALSEEFSHLLVGIFSNEAIVQRTLNNINNETTLRALLGNEYDELMDFYDNNQALVAEEALGQLLRKNLLKQESESLKGTGKNLFSRAVTYIKNKFKPYNYTEVEQAIIDADANMSQMAKNIFSGALQITEERVAQAMKRNIQFNALSDRIEHNIKILKEAKFTEKKRLSMNKYSAKIVQKEIQNTINTLDIDLLPNKDGVLGLMHYSMSALKTLQESFDLMQSIPTMPPSLQFKSLRRVRDYILSYGSFIDMVRDEILESDNDPESNGFYDDITIGDEVLSLRDVIKDLDDLSSNLKRLYAKHAVELFSEFCKPFFGESITMNGKKMTIEQVLENAESDISFMDMWLDSMANSSDLMLQLFDSIVKNAKNNARFKTINEEQEIHALMLEAEEKGFKEFGWMYEKDSDGNLSGNFISEINFAEFDKAKERMEKDLEEKYGKNARGEKAAAKIKERAEWYKNNTIGADRRPNHKYENQDFKKLSTTQLEIRKKILDLKAKMDSRYPTSKVDALKAIQMRKSTGNRFLKALSSPSALWENVKEGVKATFAYAEDDDALYGERTTKSLKNFDGSEFMLLPTLYTTRLKNPNELSTDIFATLLGYSYSTNLYNEMESIIDPLEVGKTIITDKIREVNKTRGGKVVEEVIGKAGDLLKTPIKVLSSNIEAKLNAFMSSQVYQKYIKDEGTIGETNLSTSKTLDFLRRVSSLADLGFNWLSNIANASTGAAMGNIEAAANRFFGISELFAADKEYTKALADFLPELGERVKTSKLALFTELFNTKRDFSGNIKRNHFKNLFQKIFGENLAFLGQECGDHWLYNRIAIARCLRIKVLVPKNQTIRRIIKGEEAAKQISEVIIANSQNIKLNENETFYTDASGQKRARVTSAIQAEGENNAFQTIHEDGKPNNWIIPATNIGTGVDEMVRDFMGGKITRNGTVWENNGNALSQIYPNASEESLQKFCEELESLKSDFEKSGLTIIPRDVVVNGYGTVNVGGKLKQLPIAGTLDILAYDKDGNFYIFDMKTHRGNISYKKRNKWSSQLSLYKKFLEDEYGIRVKETAILPIKVDYPVPVGEKAMKEFGETEYTVSEGNQLLANGEVFKGAQPHLEEKIPISTKDVILEYNELSSEEKKLVTTNKKSYNVNDYTEMSLWDALQVDDAFTGNNHIKKLSLPEGTIRAEDGESVNIGSISEEIGAINESLYGIYDQENANAASQLAVGRIIQQYRQWMKPQFNKRFEAKRYDIRLHREVEGYYRTLFRVANDLRRGEIQLGTMWETLNEEDKANLRSAITEMVQLLAVFILARFIDWPRDKQRPWAIKFAEYMAQRELHELGGLTPSPLMVSELSKTVQNVFPCMSTVNRMRLALFSLVDPEDWTNEIQSGPYKGMNNVEKYWLRAPIPGVSWYRQIDRFMDDLDTSVQFYTRPSY